MTRQTRKTRRDERNGWNSEFVQNVAGVPGPGMAHWMVPLNGSTAAPQLDGWLVRGAGGTETPGSDARRAFLFRSFGNPSLSFTVTWTVRPSIASRASEQVALPHHPSSPEHGDRTTPFHAVSLVFIWAHAFSPWHRARRHRRGQEMPRRVGDTTRLGRERRGRDWGRRSTTPVVTASGARRRRRCRAFAAACALRRSSARGGRRECARARRARGASPSRRARRPTRPSMRR